MRVFEPSKKSTGYIWGGLLFLLVAGAVGIGAVAMWLLPDFRSKAPAIAMTVFGVFIAGLFAYLLYGLKTLRYELDDHLLVIRWGLVHIAIPFGLVTEVRKAPGSLVGFRTFGAAFPGCYIGMFRFKGMGTVEAFTTRLTGDIVLVSTTRTTYLLSPDDPDAFTALLGRAVSIAPAESDVEIRHVPPVWADPLAMLLMGANVAFFAGIMLYLSRLVPSLPHQIPAHWDMTGAVNRHGSREELYMLPIVGAVVAALPAVMGMTRRHPSRKFIYFLAATSMALQLLFACILWGWVSQIRG